MTKSDNIKYNFLFVISIHDFGILLLKIYKTK